MLFFEILNYIELKKNNLCVTIFKVNILCVQIYFKKQNAFDVNLKVTKHF